MCEDIRRHMKIHDYVLIRTDAVIQFADLSGSVWCFQPANRGSLSPSNLKVGLLFKPGLCSRYTKLPTPTPRFLKLRLLHKSSICINNDKPIRHFIATT
jgi:hypothetical protein